MSWASARAQYLPDDDGDPTAHGGTIAPTEGPHEVGYRWCWRVITGSFYVLIGLMPVALVLAVLADGFDLRAPDTVNDALTAVLITAWALMGTGWFAMFGVDALDRRRAWRDDELQAALPITHPLARPSKHPSHTADAP